tara:strand:- start:152 stop:1309 length:1158 start_codon:yes stop_codon:yes gene_type:complete
MVQRALHTAGEYRLGRHRGQYVAKYTDGDKDSRIKIGLATTEPEQVAIQVFTNWVHIRTAVLASQQDYSIGDLFGLYVADRERAGKNVSKFQHQWASLRATFQHLQPSAITQPMRVGKIDLTICHKYALERRQAGRARATIHSELNTLRSCLSWAAKHGHILSAPLVWTPKEAKSRDTHLTAVQVMTLLDEARSHHVRLALSIALYTGARKGAILDLTWDRVDLAAGTIQFAIGTDDDDAEDILDSSHKKGRAFVAIHPVLYPVLSFAKSIAQSNHVIEYRGGRVKDIAHAVGRAVKRAGLGGRFIGLHALRHTLATMAADAGTEMRVIQKMVGHDDIRTTEKLYAKHSPSYTLPAAEAVARQLNAAPEKQPDHDNNAIDILVNP